MSRSGARCGRDVMTTIDDPGPGQTDQTIQDESARTRSR